MVTTIVSRNDKPTPPIIETEGLCVRFGRQVVLNQISISIQRGETIAIIGESG